MEQWKDVVGYEGSYEVSDLGRVRSVQRLVVFSDGRRRRYEPIVLRTYTDDYGYPKVTLKRSSVGLRVHVHVLVAAAFVGPRPEGYQVLHNNGNGKDCRAANLRYGTSLDNHADALKHGTRVFGEKQGMSKLTHDEVTEIKSLRGKYTCRELADMFGWVHHA